MFEKLREDYRMSTGRRGGLWWGVPLRFVTMRGFRVVCLLRVSEWFERRGIGMVGRVLRWVCREWFTVDVHRSAKIGPGLALPHAFGIVIGPGVTLGARPWIFNGVSIMSGPDGKAPVAGVRLTAYAGAQIMGGVRLGDRVTVGVNAVVVKDVADDTTVAAGRQIVIPRSATGGGA